MRAGRGRSRSGDSCDGGRFRTPTPARPLRPHPPLGSALARRPCAPPATPASCRRAGDGRSRLDRRPHRRTCSTPACRAPWRRASSLLARPFFPAASGPAGAAAQPRVARTPPGSDRTPPRRWRRWARPRHVATVLPRRKRVDRTRLRRRRPRPTHRGCARDRSSRFRDRALHPSIASWSTSSSPWGISVCGRKAARAVKGDAQAGVALVGPRIVGAGNVVPGPTVAESTLV